MPVTLTFCGAAGTVTGSCYLLSAPAGRLLIDCGMYQGSKTLRELNYGAFPFDAADIAAVLLTHAHVDHAGLLPKLYAAGFRGPIHATPETIDLLGWVLPDSGAIQEADVARLNRRNRLRDHPMVTPIYTRAIAETSLKLLSPVGYGAWVDVIEGVRARYWNAGHILGAASIELEVTTGDPRRRLMRLLFSGDLGPEGKPLRAPAAAPENFDHIVVESTYADRERPVLTQAQRRDALAEVVTEALGAGGNLLIPAFAIERTQELLFDLAALIDAGALANRRVFIDSPLATAATAVFEKHGAGASFHRDAFRYVSDVEESIALDRITAGAIIIAGSGMCEGGRIRHHLRSNLWRPDATVLMIGYQAPGTLGHVIEQGAKHVRIHGEPVAVRCHVRKLDVYSGHADRNGLLAWVADRLPVSGGVFLVHGEEAALEAMKAGVVGLGVPRGKVAVPWLDQTYRLDGGLHLRPMESSLSPRLGSAPSGAVARDWHNEYAALALEIQERLRRADGEGERRKILRRLNRALK